MNTTGANSTELQEALYELRRFLSDEVAPLTVADSVSLLLENDPEIIASGIRSWVESQLLRQQTISTASYLYHALKKLRVVGDLNLVSKDRLGKYLQYLSQFAINCCPLEERQILASNLSQLDGTSTSFDAPVNFFYQPQSISGVQQPAQPLTVKPHNEYSKDLPVRGGRRFDLLLERLEDRPVSNNAGSTYPLPSYGGGNNNFGSSQPFQGRPLGNNELAARAFALAVGNSQTEAELEQYLHRLGQNSLQTSSQNIFMTLGQSLPDWALLAHPVQQGNAAAAPPLARSDSLLEAMQRMVSLASDPAERAKRFNEIVQAAILQFNEGWLGRAVSMLDTADGLIATKEVETSTSNFVRQKGHEKISYDQLRAYVESPHQRPLLRKVLGFFEDLTPQGLLTKLRVEPVRHRRRLIMTLLEIHGADARPIVFKTLQSTVEEQDEKIWYFQRNLLHLLHLIPRDTDVCPDDEINTVIPFTQLNHPTQVAREALSNLALKNDTRAEKALIERLQEYERALLNPEQAPFPASDLRLLLDRVVFVLIRVGTPRARLAIVDHGLKREPQFGDTLARLAELSSQDLSNDDDLVERILYALAREIPNKLLSVFVKKDEKDALNLIKSLSGTPAPTVNRFFTAVAKKHPNREYGKAAADAVTNFEQVEAAQSGSAKTAQTEKVLPKSSASSSSVKAAPATTGETQPIIAPSAALSGDLAIFGLPALLQNLADSRLSGVLTLKNQAAEIIGTITLDEGKIRASTAKRLRNVDAVYQLLQKPLAGTFQFVQLENLETNNSENVSGEPLELIPVLLEGMRRYDELQAACAVVPDEATFTVNTAVEPTPHEEETDKNLVQAVWESVKAGATAAECESQLIIDSYRVRRLLSHWVEQGALKLTIPD